VKKTSILRPDDNGKPDDIVISCDLVHIERMDTGEWWIGIYRGKKRVSIFLTSSRAINMGIHEDDFGLKDDRATGRDSKRRTA